MSSQLYIDNHNAIALVMVGVPATGKTFTARTLSRYLRWLGVRTRTFSAATYRRQLLGGVRPSADFFDPANADAAEKRRLIADMALHDLLEWLKCGGQVAILDASNTTAERRTLIEGRMRDCNVECVFVECLFSAIDVSRHVQDLLLCCPDYADMTAGEADDDYKKRIDYYYRSSDYQSLTDCPPAASGYIQLMNGGEQMVIERVNGFLFSRIIYYLMNLRGGNRAIFLVACGQQSSLLGLAQSISQLQRSPIQTWTPPGSCDRSKRPTNVVEKPRLRGLETGIPPTPNPSQPTDDLPLSNDHLYFSRNPQGESYHDLAVRLEPVIMELESTIGTDTLILADLSVIRCVYGYFCELSRSELVLFEAGEDTLLELKPRAYGCYERQYRIHRDDLRIEPVSQDQLRVYNDNVASPP